MTYLTEEQKHDIRLLLDAGVIHEETWTRYDHNGEREVEHTGQYVTDDGHVLTALDVLVYYGNDIIELQKELDDLAIDARAMLEPHYPGDNNCLCKECDTNANGL